MHRTWPKSTRRNVFWGGGGEENELGRRESRASRANGEQHSRHVALAIVDVCQQAHGGAALHGRREAILVVVCRRASVVRASRRSGPVHGDDRGGAGAMEGVRAGEIDAVRRRDGGCTTRRNDRGPAGRDEVGMNVSLSPPRRQSMPVSARIVRRLRRFPRADQALAGQRRRAALARPAKGPAAVRRQPRIRPWPIFGATRRRHRSSFARLSGLDVGRMRSLPREGEERRT